MRAVRNTAVGVAVLGLVGVLCWFWMIRYLIGPLEEVAVLKCGTYKEIYGEVADKSGHYCLLKGDYYAVHAVGVPASDGPLVITALVERGNHEDIRTIYAPSTGDFVMFALSAGFLLGGLNGLLTVVLASRRR
ncbi:hypothetical protein [Lentzea sp. NBRC 105346]|uniref:hypothetical protein n=1 Tax=Lentzea sp. NBRC 105346 TaxID=3032205 RepID=UPI0025541FCF|nr:hypothetical protein [Lentzea sp. NBRC 105346]